MTFSLDNCFRLLNFAVLSTGFVYVVRRYGIVALMTSMRLEKQKKEEMQRVHQEVLQQCDDVKDKEQEHEKSYLAMQEKFQIWQNRVEQQAIQEQRLMLRYYEELAQKQVIKDQNVQRQYLLRKQLPKLLHEVTQSLQSDFEKNEKGQKEYTAQLLKFVKERSV